MPPVAEPLALWTPPTDVVVAQHAFRTGVLHVTVTAGQTLAEILDACGLPPGVAARVWVDDWEIAPAYWRTTRPRAGRRVFVRAVASGGGGDSNKTLRIVLLVVIAVAAIAISAFAGPLIGAAFGYAGITLSAAAAGAIAVGLGAAVSIGGALLVSALLPPPKPRLNDTTSGLSRSATYALTGTQNQLAPYGVVPRVYGRHRLFPPLAAYPVTASAGTLQSLSELFTLGYGPLLIEEIKIGETDIDEYVGVTMDIREGWPNDPPITTTYPRIMYEEPLSLNLTPETVHGEKVYVRATRDASDTAGVELTFPRGLFRMDDQNTLLPMTAVATIHQRLAGTEDPWQEVLIWSFSEARTETLRFSYGWDLPSRGTWEIRMSYDIPPGWLPNEDPPNPIVIYDAVWTALRSWRNEYPIRLPNMALIGLTLQASGQLSGIVNQLNVIATSILWVYDRGSDTWSQQPTRNPAWIFLDILAGTANQRAVLGDVIDYEAIVSWAEHCEAAGYTFDAVLDSQSTVFETLSLVAAIGRASLTLRDGRYSVVRDVPTAAPVQLFTPRNSNDFRATKLFTDIPHGLRVRYINPAANWQQDEVPVFDDGYDAATATKYETLELFGVTSASLAWRHGRYWLAAARLRPETYTLGVDVEYLVANRGDVVQVQHDVPVWGYGSARIIAVVPDEAKPEFVRGVFIDELLDDLAPATTIGARIRLSDSTLIQRPVGVWPQPSTRSTLLAFAESDPAPLRVGDLVALGQLNTETVACIVSKIEAGPEFTARLTLVDAAPGIEQADTGPIPPYESQITHPPQANYVAPLPPIVDAISSDELSMVQLTSGTWVTAIRLSCHAQFDPGTLPPTAIEAQFRPIGSDGQWISLVPLPASDPVVTFYFQPVQTGWEYALRIRAVAQSSPLTAPLWVGGVPSPWVDLTHTVVGEATPPPDPTALTLDADESHLRWTYPTPPSDFGGFMVRQSIGPGTWDTATPLHGGVVSDTRFALAPLEAADYTWFVKAVDRAGNLSLGEATLTQTVTAYVLTRAREWFAGR